MTACNAAVKQGLGTGVLLGSLSHSYIRYQVASVAGGVPGRPVASPIKSKGGPGLAPLVSAAGGPPPVRAAHYRRH
jgi:hypothetical protein